MEPTIEITLNGEPRTLTAPCTVARLVEELELRPELVAVEVNARIVRRAEHATRELGPGDAVEVVTLVGGG
jgi:thiamine biosynthesis protein ThiS